MNTKKLTLELRPKIKTDLALYDLLKDEKELNNVAAAHPAIVKTLQIKADSIRLILGDKITGARGTELRPLGSIYK